MERAIFFFPLSLLKVYFFIFGNFIRIVFNEGHEVNQKIDNCVDKEGNFSTANAPALEKLIFFALSCNIENDLT
jgi:hypothetical protein